MRLCEHIYFKVGVRMGNRQKIYIGIDPGVTTGLAVWDGKDIVFHTTDFWGAIEEIQQWIVPITVVIEDPSKNKPVFHRDLKVRGDKRDRTMLKIGQNVGSNKREGQLLIEYCEQNGIECRAIKPTSSKWDAKQLKVYTGITKSTNQHVRDAIKLVYGF